MCMKKSMDYIIFLYIPNLIKNKKKELLDNFSKFSLNFDLKPLKNFKLDPVIINNSSMTFMGGGFVAIIFTIGKSEPWLPLFILFFLSWSFLFIIFIFISILFLFIFYSLIILYCLYCIDFSFEMYSRLIQVRWKNIIYYHLLIFGSGSILYCISTYIEPSLNIESFFTRENLFLLLLLLLIIDYRIWSSLFKKLSLNLKKTLMDIFFLLWILGSIRNFWIIIFTYLSVAIPSYSIELGILLGILNITLFKFIFPDLVLNDNLVSYLDDSLLWRRNFLISFFSQIEDLEIQNLVRNKINHLEDKSVNSLIHILGLLGHRTVFMNTFTYGTSYNIITESNLRFIQPNDGITVSLFQNIKVFDHGRYRVVDEWLKNADGITECLIGKQRGNRLTVFKYIGNFDMPEYNNRVLFVKVDDNNYVPYNPYDRYQGNKPLYWKVDDNDYRSLSFNSEAFRIQDCDSIQPATTQWVERRVDNGLVTLNKIPMVHPAYVPKLNFVVWNSIYDR